MAVTDRVVAAVRTGLLASAPETRPPGPELLRRRRIVALVTVVVGAVLLGLSLGVKPGDGAFYPLAVATALVWIVGGVLSGPLRLGRTNGRRPVVLPLLIGAGLAAVFIAGALLVREIGPLAGIVRGVLDFTQGGNLGPILLVTLVSGIGEEIFFRGAVFSAAAGHRPVLVSATLYALTTVATLNVMLVFAAAILGTIVSLQRRATGGLLAPIITHVTWSLTMAAALPPLFGLS